MSQWFIQQRSPWKDFLFPPTLEVFPVEVLTSRKKPRRNNSHMREADVPQDLQGHAAAEGQAGCIWASQKCVSLQGRQLSQAIMASHGHNIQGKCKQNKSVRCLLRYHPFSTSTFLPKLRGCGTRAGPTAARGLSCLLKLAVSGEQEGWL